MLIDDLDLLLFLEAPSAAVGTGDGSIVVNQFRVPTLETVSEVYPLGVQQDELDGASQIDLRNASSILSTILCLVSVHLYKSPSVSMCVGFQELEPDPIWLLETLTRLWGLLVPDIKYSRQKRFNGADHVLYLKILRQILSYIVHIKANRVAVFQIALLLCQTLECHLSSSIKYLTLPVQNVICWCVFDLYSTSMDSIIVSNAFYGYLKPVVHDNIENSNRKEHFCIDLQVGSSQ